MKNLHAVFRKEDGSLVVAQRTVSLPMVGEYEVVEFLDMLSETDPVAIVELNDVSYYAFDDGSLKQAHPRQVIHLCRFDILSENTEEEEWALESEVDLNEMVNAYLDENRMPLDNRDVSAISSELRKFVNFVEKRMGKS